MCITSSWVSTFWRRCPSTTSWRKSTVKQARCQLGSNLTLQWKLSVNYSEKSKKRSKRRDLTKFWTTLSSNWRLMLRFLRNEKRKNESLSKKRYKISAGRTELPKEWQIKSELRTICWGRKSWRKFRRGAWTPFSGTRRRSRRSRAWWTSSSGRCRTRRRPKLWPIWSRRIKSWARQWIRKMKFSTSRSIPCAKETSHWVTSCLCSERRSSWPRKKR